MKLRELAEGMLVDDRGSSIALFRPASGSGTVLRGVGVEVFREMRRLLEEGAGESELCEAVSVVDRDMALSFLARLESRGLVAARGAQPVLRDAGSGKGPVVLEGSASLVEAAGSRLAELGCEILDPSGLLDTEKRPTLGVLIDDRLEIREHLRLNREFLGSGIPFLSARLYGSRCELGPLALPGLSACYECYWERLQGSISTVPEWLADGKESAMSAGPIRESLARIAVELLSLEVERLLSGRSVPSLLGRAVSFDASTITATSHPVVEAPDCGACRFARLDR